MLDFLTRKFWAAGAASVALVPHREPDSRPPRGAVEPGPTTRRRGTSSRCSGGAQTQPVALPPGPRTSLPQPHLRGTFEGDSFPHKPIGTISLGVLCIPSPSVLSGISRCWWLSSKWAHSWPGSTARPARPVVSKPPVCRCVHAAPGESEGRAAGSWGGGASTWMSSFSQFCKAAVLLPTHHAHPGRAPGSSWVFSSSSSLVFMFVCNTYQASSRACRASSPRTPCVRGAGCARTASCRGDACVETRGPLLIVGVRVRVRVRSCLG